VTIDRDDNELQEEGKRRKDPFFARLIPNFGTAGSVFDYFSEGKDATYAAGTFFVVTTIDRVTLPHH
jgi:hypothetical protein